MFDNTKRSGRYHNVSTTNNNSIDNNNDNSSSPSYFSESASIYKDSSKKPSFDWNTPLFGNRRASLQKILANANKTTERASKFINKIKSTACLY